MSIDDRQYRLGPIQEDGQAEEDEEDTSFKPVEDQDDSPFIFDFLKRKRPMPSPRRLDYML